MMNKNYYQWPASQNSTRETASKQPYQLKSCLRRNSSSRWEFADGKEGSISIHSQPLTEPPMMHTQYQTRQDEVFSPRSEASDPIPSRSTVAFADSTAYQYRSNSSASSAPLMGNTSRSSYALTNSYTHITTEDNERQFMRVTKLLVNRHNAEGTYGNNPSLTIQILHHELPTFEQRMTYYNNLKRNVAYLPMFPEPTEHQSFAMTRYAEKIFGHILAREVKSVVGRSHADGGSLLPENQHNDFRSMQNSPIATHPEFAVSRQMQSLHSNGFEPMFPTPLPPSPYSRLSSPASYVPNTVAEDNILFPRRDLSAQCASTSATTMHKMLIPTPDPPTTPTKQPLSISTTSTNCKEQPATIRNRGLIGASTDSNSSEESIGGKNGNNSSLPSSIEEYRTLTNKDMLPPITQREKVLYYPIEHNSSSPCCIKASDKGRDNSNPLRKRPPSYHQLYIKCERSEPYINKDADIVTWYRNASDNRVTADRTLVVRSTTDLRELIHGIAKAFGLTSPDKDNTGGSADGDNNNLSLGCYKDICFVSDIKMTTCVETAETHLTPLPIPGFYYKYVDRSNNAVPNKNRKGDPRSSSVLSSDVLGLRRTLTAQVLDKPIYPCSRSSSKQSDVPEGVRTRLALVYCTPKRNAYISPRSTHHGVLPETIYHFQILLEGIVAEDDLPSSFQSQTAIRCVGATGGVLGGSIMDTQEEIDELNRSLWNGRDVIGLLSPRGNQQDKLERIIDMLRMPLFDTAGNQLPKEFVVDRCLYNICSGKLSMNVASSTRHTVEGTAEWLAQRVDDISKSLADSTIACEETYNAFENDYNFDDFDSAVSRSGKSRNKKSSWM